MANIITLTGASQCGKSLIRDMFIDCANADLNFDPILFKKETTRAARENDDDVKCVESISLECDFIYEQYGVRYGFEFSKIYVQLKSGKSPIVVVNDIRAVEDLKKMLGDQVLSIFIYRRPPNDIAFINEERSRDSLSSEESIRERAISRKNKAVAIHRIYIENIHLFDNVILNITDAVDNTRLQVEKIVAKVTKANEGLVSCNEVGI